MITPRHAYPVTTATHRLHLKVRISRPRRISNGVYLSANERTNGSVSVVHCRFVSVALALAGFERAEEAALVEPRTSDSRERRRAWDGTESMPSNGGRGRAGCPLSSAIRDEEGAPVAEEFGGLRVRESAAHRRHQPHRNVSRHAGVRSGAGPCRCQGGDAG